MKIAAIDIGTNSVHVVIVQADPSGGFRLLDSESEMVRLGEGSLSGGDLSIEAMARALAALKVYKKLAELHQVDRILVVATSAIREARNGEQFLRQIRRKTGLTTRVIPGEEEARLIYLAALQSVRVPPGRALVIDIGGGSLELALGRGSKLELGISEKLGVLRMTERFLLHDPPTPGEVRRLAKHVRQQLAGVAQKIRKAGFTTVIGTSGTILSLGRLVLHAGAGKVGDSVNQQSVQAGAIRKLRAKLVRLDPKARLKVGGMESRRTDIIVAGAIVLDTVLEVVGARQIVLCDWALREGMLLDYLQMHTVDLAKEELYPDIQMRSVMELAERCQFHEVHSRHVARLARMLFDGTRNLHGLGAEECRMLEYAALLHDVGHLISHQGHHKHSSYLIRNAGLRGFLPEEVNVLAQVARYHRGGLPRRGHPEFAALSRAGQHRVRVLAGLLRVADSLDRTQRQRVREVRVVRRGDVLDLQLRVSGEVELEQMSVPRRVTLVEQVLGVQVRLGIRRPDGRIVRPVAKGVAAA